MTFCNCMYGDKRLDRNGLYVLGNSMLRVRDIGNLGVRVRAKLELE